MSCCVRDFVEAPHGHQGQESEEGKEPQDEHDEHKRASDRCRVPEERAHRTTCSSDRRDQQGREQDPTPAWPVRVPARVVIDAPGLMVAFYVCVHSSSVMV